MIIRPYRKPKPVYRQGRSYVNGDVMKVFSEDKPLPEDTWQSVKKAVGIKGTFKPGSGNK